MTLGRKLRGWGRKVDYGEDWVRWSWIKSEFECHYFLLMPMPSFFFCLCPCPPPAWLGIGNNSPQVVSWIRMRFTTMLRHFKEITTSLHQPKGKTYLIPITCTFTGLPTILTHLKFLSYPKVHTNLRLSSWSFVFSMSDIKAFGRLFMRLSNV